MALSPEYGWPEPDNSSLVKNGAQDIRALGDAIDTSVWNVGYGQAGKNKVINGAFDNWQRGTSISLVTGTNTYGADRFINSCTFSAGSATVSRETFTPGTAPVAGYEGQYFSRLTCGSTTTVWAVRQRIENVQSFAGQTVTLSFYVKASAANATTAIQFAQNFGSGGSASVTVDTTGPSITTSWQRFTVTAAIPSVSGKTIGTSSYLEFTIYSTTGIASSLAVDLWGVQVEYGSKATPFQTATGTIQGELAACQRYYEKSYAQGIAPGTANIWGNASISGLSSLAASTAGNVYGGNTLQFKVTKRTTPTMVLYEYGGTANAVRIYPSDTIRGGVTATPGVTDTGGGYISVDSSSASAITTNYSVNFSWTASAEL
jgi:hypothetical protein